MHVCLGLFLLLDKIDYFYESSLEILCFGHVAEVQMAQVYHHFRVYGLLNIFFSQIFIEFALTVLVG